MKNLTNNFCNAYHPVQALLIWRKQLLNEGEEQHSIYVESYDIGKYEWGFTNVKLLNMPVNLKTNWISHGYPLSGS